MGSHHEWFNVLRFPRPVRTCVIHSSRPGTYAQQLDSRAAWSTQGPVGPLRPAGHRPGASAMEFCRLQAEVALAYWSTLLGML